MCTKQVARGRTRGFSRSHSEEMLRQQFGWYAPCQPLNAFSGLVMLKERSSRLQHRTAEEEQ